jgi:putative Holliday junction resolvase
MSRIMAIDYGTKRMGVAVTDPLQIIATPLTTLHPKDSIEFLKNYFAEQPVAIVVFGEPKQDDGTPSESDKPLRAYIALFKKHFPLVKVEMMDERYTSKMALNAMIDAGLKKKQRQDKGLVDRTAAVIILQEYMKMKE